MKNLIRLLLSALMLLLIACGHSNLRDTEKVNETNELIIEDSPDWVPEEKRVDFNFMLDQLKTYSSILKAEPKATRCIVNKKNLEIRIERGPMTFDITLFDVNAQSCRVTDDGQVYAVYRQESNIKNYIISFLSGAGVMFLIILLL